MATIYVSRMSTISNSSVACATVGLVNSHDEPGSVSTRKLVSLRNGATEWVPVALEPGPVTRVVCFLVVSVLTMMVSELWPRVLPVQGSLSVSGAGLRYVAGQKIPEAPMSCERG